VGEWEVFLGTVELDEAAVNQAFACFRQPALMGRACAREVAALAEEAHELSRSDPARAAQLYERCSALQPEEPSHRIAAARALAALDQLPDAALVLGKAAEAFKDAPQVLAEVQMERADVEQKRQRPEEVKKELELILAASVSAQMNRTAHVKLHALQTPAVSDALWAYFGEGKDELKLLVLQKALGDGGTDPFVHYLLGRRAAQAGAPELARPYLEKALAGELPESIHREALRLVVEAQFGAGRCDEVRQTAQAASGQPAAFRSRVQDWVDRCAFEESAFQGPLKPTGPLR
jgi:tetratricopeptide (TPR) repeat protein